MKKLKYILFFLLPGSLLFGQKPDTFLLKKALSKNDTVIYTRIISFNKSRKLYHVKDYFETGQIQMDAYYSSFNPTIKEGYQCNFQGNTKQGTYSEWYENGQQAYTCRFSDGVRNGVSTGWYSNGNMESSEYWQHGRLHGLARYWSDDGRLAFISKFANGENLKSKNASYRYLINLPDGYERDTAKKWPLVIFLHGGSGRGTDINNIYDNGIPDQVYRGRKFPFIVASPQCPEHIRWTTEDWFVSFYSEVVEKYRIDTSRIYLTGLSLGGEGVWYLAARYPDRFAAIAPVSGFTSLTKVIDENIDKLAEIPVWAFHSRSDDVVPFEETERIVSMLEGKNRNLRFSTEPDTGHWMHWSVYSGTELYEWLMKFSK